MIKYLFRRLLQVPFVMLLVMLTIFIVVRSTPGDPVQIMLGLQTSPDAVAAIRKEFRLDEPIIIQYVAWLGDLAQGDLGHSIRLHTPVETLLAERLPVSLKLASAAMLYAFLISIPLGIFAALYRNSIIDYLCTGYSVVGFAIPNFALAMILIYVFSIKLGWFPITGIGSGETSAGILGRASPYVLPAIALGTLQTAVLVRLLRSSMIEVLSQDYIRTAYSKGLTTPVVVLVHALKNALIPFVTMATIQFGYLIGIQVTIEYVFAIPGMGTAILQAVVSRDFPVIQGFTLVIAIFFLFANIAADIAHGLLDPRVRY